MDVVRSLVCDDVSRCDVAASNGISCADGVDVFKAQALLENVTLIGEEAVTSRGCQCPEYVDVGCRNQALLGVKLSGGACR